MQWKGGIRELKDSGTVTQTGERRGAKCQLAPFMGKALRER